MLKWVMLHPGVLLRWSLFVGNMMSNIMFQLNSFWMLR